MEKYNERDEENILVSGVLKEFADALVDMTHKVKHEKGSYRELGIDEQE